MSDQKLCVVCGADCAGKPRVKDPGGRYYCKACYDAKANETAGARKSASPRSNAAPSGEGDGDGLADLAGLASLAAASPAMPSMAELPTMTTPAAPRAGRSGKASAGAAGPLDYIINPGRWIRRVTANSDAKLLGAGATFLVSLLLAWGELPNSLWRFRAMSSQLGDDVAAYTDGWSFAIAFFGVASLLGGILYWLIGPWWLKLRIGWSGGSCTMTEARAALFASSLPACAMMALSAILVVIIFRGPTDVRFYLSDFFRVAFPLLAVLLLVAGTVQLWHMAWRGFGAKPVPSAILVLGLPVVVSLLGLAQAFGNRALASEGASNAALNGGSAVARGNTPAESAKPKGPNTVQHRPHPRTPVRFTYMNNWTIRPDHARGTESAGVEVRSPGGSVVYVQRYTKEECKGDPVSFFEFAHGVHLRDGMERLQLTKTADLTTFAGRAVKGYQYEGKSRGVDLGFGKATAYHLLLNEMVSPDQSVVFVRVVIAESDLQDAMPVIDKIVSTIVVEPQR